MNEERLLSREEIQQLPSDIQYETVEVPEWGGRVRVRGLTGAQRDAYEASLVKDKGRGLKVTLLNARARLVVMAAVDAKNQPLFEKEDVPWLTHKSARALNRVAEKARELSGMTEEDEEELLGNSASTPPEPSPSDSPSPSEG